MTGLALTFMGLSVILAMEMTGEAPFSNWLAIDKPFLAWEGIAIHQTSDHLEGEIAMKLNHLNLTVTDPLETQEFLIKYFALKPRGKGNHHMAFLSDDNGIVLSLMNPKVGTESEVKYPATFHVGFIQESEQAVDEINQRLKAAGFDVPLPSRQHGSWTFYFEAPGGFTVEVLA